jgi:hypothetical protein
MMKFLKTTVAVCFAVAGLHFAAIALALPGQGDPPPPVYVWGIDRPTDDSRINKNANIACQGSAAEDKNYICAIDCLSGGTWSVYNSTNGQSDNNAWSCTVNKPDGGSWVVGTNTACCGIHPSGDPSTYGQPFDITE